MYGADCTTLKAKIKRDQKDFCIIQKKNSKCTRN